MSASHSPRSRVRDLVARYGSDGALGARYHEEEGASVLPDGGRASSCSDCAYYIRELESNTAIYGFWSKDNPSWAGAKLQDGHDFAIVEGRYIVDPWIKETEGLSKRAVFDLETPADAREINRLFGNPLNWQLVEGPSPANETDVSTPQPVLAARVMTDAEFRL